MAYMIDIVALSGHAYFFNFLFNVCSVASFFNFTPHQGVKLILRGEVDPLGAKVPTLGATFTPSFTPGVNTLYCLDKRIGELRVSSLGDKFTHRG
jgi:hypothetical protein